MFDLQKTLFMAAVLAFGMLFGIQNAECTREYTAALFRNGLPNEDSALIEALANEIKAAGYLVTHIDGRELCDRQRLSISNFDLLVIPDASTLPAKSTSSIEAYLKEGGDIIALNTPMWQKALINLGGRWLTREAYQRESAGKLPENVIFNFTPKDIADWTRSSDTMEAQTITETVAEGPAAGQRSLHIIVSNLKSYDTFGNRSLDKPFPEGHTLTVFSAKGDERTTQLAIEWDEKDGSRWIATVALTPEWRQYVLTPEDFKFWISVPNRGGRGDHFNPENAVAMSVGLAQTHTSAIGTGRFEYWVGPFGTAKMTPEYQELLNAIEPPALDTLSPSYKLFDSTEVASIVVRKDQVIVPPTTIPLPSSIRSPHPRPKGGGFDKGRDWRWIPILEARTAEGEWRGNPVTMMVHASGPFKGGVWASFGIGDTNWYKQPEVRRVIRQIAEKMHDGIFFLDGGTNFYTYFEDQQIKVGFNVVNLSNEHRNDLVGHVKLMDQRSGEVLYSHEWPLTVAGNSTIAKKETVWESPEWPKAGLIAEAALFQGSKEIDRVTHEVGVWKPKKEKHFVTIKNGEFMLDGKRWRPCGVNYMPSSGIGIEDGNYFEHYLSARSYDPEVFQRDIEHIKDLGYNAVSIFVYSGYEKAQNLNDLLRRLEKLGLKANLALRPGTPMNFLWPQIGEIIKNARLMDNDTIFAYDLAWEPSFGHQRDRVIWDGEWEKWIIERYGSIENAENDWGFAVPRDKNGKVTNPLPHQIDSSGPWNRMTAAYRRFLDTLLYKKYSAARRLVRSVDPNHLISFRMAEAANPTFRWEGRIPYDFPYLAGAVDFLAPEAYGRIGEWEAAKPGWFQREWARLWAPQLPMIWAEQGCSTWEMGRMQTSPIRLDFQAKHYKAFYEMLIKSCADGIFSWWYPGGFRYGENSDFGIINPDGSDRPVTRVIREYAPKFISAPSAKKPDFWITVDRDKYPDGIAGVYDEVKELFWQAIENGHVPALRTEGTGTDSTNCPLIAVGNTPCKGNNPPKYLDAAFDTVEVKDANGKWVLLQPGDTVPISKNKQIEFKIQFTNLGEAKLIAPANAKGRQGGVYITCTLAGGGEMVPIKRDVGHLESGNITFSIPFAQKNQTEITFSFKAANRTPFGEKFRLTLMP
ncbi:MAG: hypothetical protein K6T99_04075 [Armatimonadetes bacterium]|nr:hypothetical protein [Armatimonadota bacterium]